MRRVVLFAGVIMHVGCVEQEPARPTEADWKVIKQNILKEAPKPKYEVNADLEGKVTYLGLDVNREVLKPGQPFTLTHYWKVIQPVPDWQIFVHLDNAARSRFINADHGPVGGRYPAGIWKAGEIIRDQHDVTLPEDWADPQLIVYTGLWKGSLRMQPKGPQDDQKRIIAAQLKVDVPGQKEAAKPKQVVAFRTDKPVKLDGKLDDPVWAAATSTGLFVNTMTGAAAPIASEAKLAWDDQFLYVAFDNKDDDVWSSLKARDEKLWTQEAVEVFIDANGDGKDYVEIQVNPNGAIFDSYLPGYRENQNDWNSGTKAAVAVSGTVGKRDDKDSGWTVEIAVPWADTKGKGKYDLRLPPKPGDTWRINLFRLDMPREKPQVAAGWSAPLVGDFHRLNRFGALIFGDASGKAVAAESAAPSKPADQPAASVVAAKTPAAPSGQAAKAPVAGKVGSKKVKSAGANAR